MYVFYPHRKCDWLWTIRQLAGRRLAPFAPRVYVGVGKSFWKYKRKTKRWRWKGGGRPCCLCIVSWRRWCVTWRAKNLSPRRRTRGVGVAEDLWLEFAYLTRPAPTHPRPPSQFPGWGPDLGVVPPLSWGFCHSHYHLTPWGVLQRMELKFGSPKTSCLLAIFHCMVRYGTVRFGTVHFWGVFHWVLYLVPGTFLVPPRPGFQAIRTVTKTWRVNSADHWLAGENSHYCVTELATWDS